MCKLFRNKPFKIIKKRNKKGEKVSIQEKKELIKRVMLMNEPITKVAKELKIKYQNAKGILYFHRKK